MENVNSETVLTFWKCWCLYQIFFFNEKHHLIQTTGQNWHDIIWQKTYSEQNLFNSSRDKSNAIIWTLKYFDLDYDRLMESFHFQWDTRYVTYFLI